MILFGQYDSPFVRRVAVSLHHYEVPFERRVLSVFADFDAMLRTNPLGKVPALQLDDGELLFDSQIILDYLDGSFGHDRPLVPASGAERRLVLRRMIVALGLAEKAVALRMELHQRSSGKVDPAWVERLQVQIGSALHWLETQFSDPTVAAEALRQDVVTTAVTYTYLLRKHGTFMATQELPGLAALNSACEALLVFRAAPFLEG